MTQQLIDSCSGIHSELELNQLIDVAILMRADGFKVNEIKVLTGLSDEIYIINRISQLKRYKILTCRAPDQNRQETTYLINSRNKFMVFLNKILKKNVEKISLLEDHQLKNIAISIHRILGKDFQTC